VKTVAARGEGVAELVERLDEHWAWLESSGELLRRRTARAAGEIEAIAVTALRERLGDLHQGTALDTLAAEVVAGKTDPYAAADRLVADVTEA
jgi:LAO/AO transport system kinase